MSYLEFKNTAAKTENPCVPGSIPGGTTEKIECKAQKAPLKQRGFFFGKFIVLLKTNHIS